PTKLAYVMGAGHSGSTILGITLGNCDGFFYAGELEEWLMTSERPRWGAADRQDFWSAVRDRVQGAEALYGDRANRCIERSSVSFRVDLWPSRRRMRPLYRSVAEQLVTAVADVAGARYVVDTSHFPLRARELRKLAAIELYLIYLVRDPRDVVASNTRELSPHEVAELRWRRLTMNANLWLTQLLSLRTFLSHPADRRIFVRHEDFLQDPAGVTRQILAMLGSDAALPDLQALTVGAPLQGNQLIRADSVAIRQERPRRRRPDPTTSLAQSIWRPLLKRLRPVATPSGAA
ncbi:MAG TPA: sulfotransferase, partial [Solirubrobacteraceae bacterium]|nr:sulfotransferase [Solirubrobacteraceae bacterium]